MAKFKVGDRVRYVSGRWFSIGDELHVMENDSSDHMPLLLGRSPNDVNARWVNEEDVELIEETAPSSEILTRIAAIESELAALKALAQAVEQPEPAPTGNAARKAVIEKARAFVADLTKRARGMAANTNGNYTFNHRKTVPTFYVNAEKGVVTALAYRREDGALLDKAFARCAPGDVFNADIGKAIAVGRLYGVEVPAEFFDAPKPDKKVAGMVVSTGEYNATLIPNGERMNPFDYFAHVDSMTGRSGKIIDDTEAQY